MSFEGEKSFLQQLSTELRKIGFSEKAALIYAALLKMGSAYPSHIAEVTRLNRTTVYKVLNDLCLKGLVTEIDKNNKLCFQLEKPARLLNFVKRQIAQAEDRYEKAQKIFPELKDIFASIPDKPFVRFFEGGKGVVAAYEDQMENFEGQELVTFMNTNEFGKIIPPRFINKYLQARVDAGVKLRCIAPKPESGAALMRYYRRVEKRLWPKYKYIDPAQFPFKSHISIYGTNRVSIVNIHAKAFIGIIIEDQTINSMMRMIFDLAWNGIQDNTEEEAQKDQSKI
jgi:sugar-specific transcriptional regulator TrmB